MKVSATCYSHSTQIRACVLVNGTPTWTMSDSLLKSEICGWPMCFPWSMNIIEQLSVVMSAMLLCDSQWGLASLESFVKKSSMLKINCHLQMLVDCFQFSFITAPFISKCPGTCEKWSSQKVPRLYRHIETCRDESVSWVSSQLCRACPEDSPVDPVVSFCSMLHVTWSLHMFASVCHTWEWLDLPPL